MILIWGLLSFSIIVVYDTFSHALGIKGWQRFISTFILFYFHVILSEFLLGLTFLLTPLNLLLFNLLIVLALGFLLTKWYGKAIYKSYFGNFKRSLRWGLRSLAGDGLFISLLALATVTVSWLIFLGILFPVFDVDGNAYHMTYIANAIQNHHIYDAQTSIEWLKGYPKGGELIQMWNVMIPKNDLLADLAQLLFVFLGVTAVYGISLRLGIEKRTARFASLLLLFLPVVINQAKTTYVDIIFSSLFLAAIAILIKKNLSRFDLVLLGILYSLLISVKPTGLLVTAITLPLLALHFIDFKQRKLIYAVKQSFLRIGLIIVPITFGLFWYVKNLILYGSPLYPFGLQAFGYSIFPGKTFQEFIATAFSNFSVMPEGPTSRLWFVWTEQKDWFGCLYNYDATFSGLGPVWFIVLLPSIPIALFIAAKKKNYMFLALAFVLLATLLLYPANFYARYTIFIVALGILAYGLIANIIWRPARLITGLILVWLAYNVLATTFTLCNYTPKAVREQLNASRNGAPRDTDIYKTIVGEEYLYLQKRMRPGEKVAYDSKPYYIYPLWRQDFSNKVIYLPAQTREEWLKLIKQENVHYVFLNSKSKEHRWAEQSNLKSIYKGKLNEIYQTY